MDPRFAEVIENLDPAFRRLLAMQPAKPTALPKMMPGAGVYLFSEGSDHLYVGRSNNLKGRIGRHWRPGATHRMAAFAFRLARKVTGKLEASYRKEGSRAALIRDPEFRRAFEAAKARIGQMDVRFVEEADPIRQAILEVYAAVTLQTPYNDFDTH